MTLFNPTTLHLHALRAHKTFNDHAFLFKHAREELDERLLEMKRKFDHVLEISPYSLQQPVHIEEGRGHLQKDRFDLIFSCLHAHWINDLPKFLTMIHTSLKPGGLFLGALWGGSTLYELRESLVSAELELTGGGLLHVLAPCFNLLMLLFC